MNHSAQNKNPAQATWQITEQLLEVDSLEEALTGSLEIIVKVLNSEAGIVWFLDEKTERLVPIRYLRRDRGQRHEHRRYCDQDGRIGPH